MLDVSEKQVCFCLGFIKKIIELNNPAFYGSISLIKLRSLWLSSYVIFVRLVFSNATICIYIFLLQPLSCAVFLRRVPLCQLLKFRSALFGLFQGLIMNRCGFERVRKFQRSGKDIIIPDVLHFMCICWTMSSHFSSKNNSQSPFMLLQLLLSGCPLCRLLKFV